LKFCFQRTLANYFLRHLKQGSYDRFSDFKYGGHIKCSKAGMKQWLVLSTVVGTAPYFGFVSLNTALNMAMAAFLLVMGWASLEGFHREFALAKAKV